MSRNPWGRLSTHCPSKACGHWNDWTENKQNAGLPTKFRWTEPCQCEKCGRQLVGRVKEHHIPGKDKIGQTRLGERL
jgi:hypothetical protein